MREVVWRPCSACGKDLEQGDVYCYCPKRGIRFCLTFELMSIKCGTKEIWFKCLACLGPWISTSREPEEDSCQPSKQHERYLYTEVCLMSADSNQIRGVRNPISRLWRLRKTTFRVQTPLWQSRVRRKSILSWRNCPSSRQLHSKVRRNPPKSQPFLNTRHSSNVQGELTPIQARFRWFVCRI